MAFKINIASKDGKTFKLDSESDAFIGLKLGDGIAGKDVKSDLDGYEFMIAGASDKAGFPAYSQFEGVTLKRVLLKHGFGMKENKPKGMRKRKTVRGNTISADVIQINLTVKKAGSKSLTELFPEQNKKPEKPAEAQAAPAAAA